MIVAFLVSLFVVALVFAGGLIQAGYLGAGFGIITPVVILAGIVFARLQAGWFSGVVTATPLTLGQFKQLTHTFSDDVQFYIANPDLAPASGLFTCKLDGRQAIVIERETDGQIV